MPRLTFDQAVEALGASAAKPWRMGLDRMEALCERLGLSDYIKGESRPLYFHVAGTNGKGSTTCMIQHLLVEVGYETGAAASPFVYDVRERVQHNLNLISKDDFARLTGKLLEVSEALAQTEFGYPSEFELKTALAFLYWHEVGVNAAALETGMGGRLDATNVVSPAVSVITSIGLDHMEHLGDTLSAIAGEKAGIIKSGRPVIVGRLEPSAMARVSGVATKHNSPLHRLGYEILIEDHGVAFDVSIQEKRWTGFTTHLYGSFQTDNAALALAALYFAGVEVTEEAARQALARAAWPGRFEVHQWEGLTVVLDGAHNQESAQALAESLRKRYPVSKIGAALGMLKGHQSEGVIAPLRAVAEYVAAVQIPSDRAQNVEEIARSTNPALQAFYSPLECAIWLKDKGCEVIVFSGSFYLLGPAKKELSLQD